MKRIFLILILVSTVCYAHLRIQHHKTSADTIKIHPIGDSITRGAEGDCYRHYLKSSLKNEGIIIDYVGLCTHGPAYQADWKDYPEMAEKLENDIEHSGWGGLKIHEIMDMTANTKGFPKITIEEEVSSAPADFILLMAGTNDIISKYLLDAAPERFAELVTRIHNSSDAHLIVSNVPPTPLPTAKKRIDTLNSKIKTIMDSLVLQWDNLTFLDINSTLSDTDYTHVLSDAYHPNSEGFKVIAEQWHRTIVRKLVAVDEDKHEPVQDFRLMQNYPNPFNPSTRIQFALQERQFAQLKLFDVLGKEIATLVNENKSPGEYEIEFNARNLPGGVYFYCFTAGAFSESKKMILLR